MGLAALLLPALCLDGLAEPAPGVGHATHVPQAIDCHNRVVAIIAVRLHVACKAGQQTLGLTGAATGVVVIQDDRLIRWPTALQPQVGLGLCGLMGLLQYLHWRFVHLQDVIGQ